MDRSIELARSLEAAGAKGARVAIVAGSGIGGLAALLGRGESIPFEALDGMPLASVPGHAGRMILGDVGAVRVLVQAGRVHLYEGKSAEEVTRSVRAFARIGCTAIVLTNAAGGLRREWTPPVLMRIEDHLNLTGHAAVAWNEAGTADPYDEALGAVLDRSAREAAVTLERGAYAGLVGPSYETPAEIRMLACAGADAVGMSTVCEASAARVAGMRVAGIACLTNHAAGISTRPLAHEEVLAAGAAVSESLARILERAIPRIAELAEVP